MPDQNDWQQDGESLVARYLEKPREELKDLILLQYSGMVERIARRYVGLEPFEDLVQVGYIGLLNALGKFDPTAGVRFNTYASYLVAGEIKHYLRDRAQTIRHPAWLQELRHKVNKAQRVLQQELGRTPTERELAEHVGVAESAILEVIQTQEMLKVASLDAAPSGDEDGDTEAERLDAAMFCPEQLSVEDRLVLEQAMSQLRELEQKVLMMFHFETLTQTEIAQQLGISCNYVSHILRQSLGKLRKILANENEQERALRRQAMSVDYEVIEPLTGAYTEAFFHARLEEEMHRASCENASVAVVLVNFHGLETLRSFYGEQSVHDFLADAAEFFRSNVRRLDLVCRYGETGFSMILPLTGANASLVRDRLVQRIESWMSGRSSQKSPVRIAVGHASYPEGARSVRDLLKAAAPGPSAQAA